MDDRQFDALVKRVAQVRLSRLDALRGVAASALVGLAGVTLTADESAATPHRHGKDTRHGTGQGKATRHTTRRAHVRNDPPNDPLPPPPPTTTTPAPSCQPDCFSKNKQCGDNGCGGICGTCAPALTCGGGGVPFKCGCTPTCENKACGPDGCGGSCGSCEGGASCVEATGQCVGGEKGKCHSKKARQRAQEEAEECEHAADDACFSVYEGNLPLAVTCALDLAKCCALHARCLPTACSCLNDVGAAYKIAAPFCGD
jgi:hypothetical protein